MIQSSDGYECRLFISDTSPTSTRSFLETLNCIFGSSALLFTGRCSTTWRPDQTSHWLRSACSQLPHFTVSGKRVWHSDESTVWLWLICLRVSPKKNQRSLWVIELVTLKLLFNHWLQCPVWMNVSKLNTVPWYLQKRKKSYKPPQHLQTYRWSHCRIPIFLTVHWNAHWVFDPRPDTQKYLGKLSCIVCLCDDKKTKKKQSCWRDQR